MDRKLRVAIVGAGLMGRWHAYYARRCGADVVAIVDRDPAAARRLSGSLPASQPFDDLPSMLRQIHPTVLHVCTPSGTHGQIAEISLQAGAHLLIEKPLTVSAAESERLLELAESAGLQICPVHQFVFQDGVLRAAAHLPLLGQILHFHAVFCSAGGASADPSALDEIAGEILPHPLSLIASMWPGSLPHRNWSAMHSGAGEIRAFLQQEGISCSLIISMHGRPTKCSFEITASGGSIYVDLFHGFAAIEPPGVSRTRKILHPFETPGRRLWSAAFNLAGRALSREPAYAGLRRLIEHFYAAISLNQTAPLDRAAILGVARARENILLAAGIRIPEDTLS
jgi:predicted dehydrogenase